MHHNNAWLHSIPWLRDKIATYRMSCFTYRLMWYHDVLGLASVMSWPSPAYYRLTNWPYYVHTPRNSIMNLRSTTNYSLPKHQDLIYRKFLLFNWLRISRWRISNIIPATYRWESSSQIEPSQCLILWSTFYHPSTSEILPIGRGWIQRKPGDGLVLPYLFFYSINV